MPITRPGVSGPAAAYAGFVAKAAGAVALSASWADWLADPNKTVCVLLELTPSMTLTGWTLTPAQSNTYQITQAAMETAGDVAGGVYRRVVGVRQSATDLTEQTSIATVEATAGSWWWDEANALLYVHTTSGAGPDTFTTIQAFVRFYVSDCGVVLDRVDDDADTGIYYHPWLATELPALTASIEQDFGAIVAELGDVVLVNAHAFWHEVFAEDGVYTWKNKQAAFYVGGTYDHGERTLRRSQYAQVVTQLVDDLATDETVATITLKQVTRLTAVEIPVTPIFESEFPHLGDDVRGTRKWIGYGRGRIAPDLVDTSVSQGVWLCADPAVQTLFAVHAVWAVPKGEGATDGLTEDIHYTVDLNACTITVTDATYRHETHALVVELTGKPDGAGSYIKTFARIVEDLLTTFVGLTAADLDTESFAIAEARARQELSLWIKSPRTVGSIIASAQRDQPSLAKSVLGTVSETVDGKIRVDVFDPRLDTTGAVVLTQRDFSVFRTLPKIDHTIKAVRVHGNRDMATQAWQVESYESSRIAFEAETEDQLDLFTYLRHSRHMQTLAQRVLVLSEKATEVECELRGAPLVASVVGDVVVASYTPAAIRGGAFTDQTFQLVRLDRQFVPTVRTGGAFALRRNLSSVTGTWAPTGAPTGPAPRRLSERCTPSGRIRTDGSIQAIHPPSTSGGTGRP